MDVHIVNIYFWLDLFILIGLLNLVVKDLDAFAITPLFILTVMSIRIIRGRFVGGPCVYDSNSLVYYQKLLNSLLRQCLVMYFELCSVSNLIYNESSPV